jgi:predicted transcriptional regulator
MAGNKKTTSRWDRNPRNPIKELRKSSVVSLMRRGYTQQEVADELGIPYRTVMNVWYDARAEMRSRREVETKEQVQLMIDELEEVKREAWKEWERSKLDAVEVHQKRGRKSSKAPQSQETNQITKGRLGDPRYLTIIQNAIDAQAELLALYPPKQGPNMPVATIPWDVLMGMVRPPSPQEIHAKIVEARTPVSIEARVIPPPSEDSPMAPEFEDFPEVIEAEPGVTEEESPTDSPPAQSPTPHYQDTIEQRIVELTNRAKAAGKVKAQEEAVDGPKE